MWKIRRTLLIGSGSKADLLSGHTVGSVHTQPYPQVMSGPPAFISCRWVTFSHPYSRLQIIILIWANLFPYCCSVLGSCLASTCPKGSSIPLSSCTPPFGMSKADLSICPWKCLLLNSWFLFMASPLSSLWLQLRTSSSSIFSHASLHPLDPVTCRCLSHLSSSDGCPLFLPLMTCWSSQVWVSESDMGSNPSSVVYYMYKRRLLCNLFNPHL